MLKIDIEAENKRLRKKTPIEIIEWAISLSEKRVVTTTNSAMVTAQLVSVFQAMGILYINVPS